MGDREWLLAFADRPDDLADSARVAGSEDLDRSMGRLRLWPS
jgi:hypothetical protein